MKKSFFRVESPDDLNKLATWDSPKVELQQVICPIDKMHQRGGKRLTNLSVTLPHGEVQDFVWTWQSECLVQENTLKKLQLSGFSGFETKPVNVRFINSNESPPKLFELVPTGWGGVARSESGIRLDESKSCSACGYLKYTGLISPENLIDESAWDGSDLFIVWPMPRYIFVTERVVKMINDNKFSGIKIWPAEALPTTDGFSPGRLSYWMPDQRAHELGDNLGIF